MDDLLLPEKQNDYSWKVKSLFRKSEMTIPEKRMTIPEK